MSAVLERKLPAHFEGTCIATHDAVLINMVRVSVARCDDSVRRYRRRLMVSLTATLPSQAFSRAQRSRRRCVRFARDLRWWARVGLY